MDKEGRGRGGNKWEGQGRGSARAPSNVPGERAGKKPDKCYKVLHACDYFSTFKLLRSSSAAAALTSAVLESAALSFFQCRPI